MAEELLLRQNGEFYPFGAEIDDSGELKNIGHYDGDEFPLSQTKIDELRKYFQKETENKNIRAYAITFDCLVKRSEDSEKIDAIAIDCYLRESGQRTIYYFPYKRATNGNLEFEEPWGISMD
jgi:hypothetical protein